MPIELRLPVPAGKIAIDQEGNKSDDPGGENAATDPFQEGTPPKRQPCADRDRK